MDVKVYTVNGAVAGSSSSIPDWLIRKRAAKGKGKRVSKEHVQGAIELIQGFEFPEASNKIKTTRDGHHAIATGTYKPQTRVWDLDDLNLKFERHSDAENVDFIILSDDWTKIMHLQNDRTIELHTQGGFHYRTRIPRFGRSLAYHFPSCTALFSASGNEIYRLNLEQGRFLSPLVLQDDNVQGVNCIDINPAHNLLAFGVEGNGTVQFWDLRSRSSVGVLRVPTNRLSSHTARSTMPGVDDTDALSIGITALASRSDGLSYVVGTSTGHTLLYDIRSTRPFALKDQGYGLPIRNLTWIEGSRLAGDGMVLSADKKVVKIWDRNSPSSNFVSITPANDLNHIHHVPGSGLFLTANEGIQMGTYYVPALGPAPRWASFLENVTEEMEDSTTRNAYEDFKFVERSELKTCVVFLCYSALDHLVGTPALKPYMHGYFLSLHLYDTARVIANPFAYAEHREKLVKERMEKMAETRIRTKKGTGVGTGTGVGGEEVKVNKALAERIEKGLEKERRKEERKRRRGTKGGEDEEAMDVDIDVSADEAEQTLTELEKPTLLNDPRFKDLFLNPEFAVDETTREYALLHPSASGSKQKVRGKTAVEEEEEESERASSAGISEDESESEGGEGGDSDDSSDAGELNTFDPRARPGQKNETRTPSIHAQSNANVNFVPLVPHTEAGTNVRKTGDKTATFGQRRNAPARGSSHTMTPYGAANGDKRGFEMSWVPSTKDPSRDRGSRKDKNARKGVEVFGAGMERGGGDGERAVVLSESERTGRSQRRKGMRSGSKNVFRQLG
ncbi:WD40-repeat-containing domain protein [Suillus subalutaceus]|uniref:WD40-repeat-containing domain protein n=1 Tax=Suillus subalutaceus TaxID=48586 RepID=UPI001B85B796|nr:WD40-repeat-containing domain protein [Suillus subalutaceus]KAG1840827.1 WD40-repeat-containing domain protein [Suillus subalutaceus]